AQEIVLIIFEHSLKRVALEEDAAFEVAQAVAGGGGGVADDGARLVPHALAGQPRSPAEVDVLEIREVVVIEAADGQKRAASRDHVAAAGKEQLVSALRLAARSDRVSKPVLKCVAVEGHHTADEVDQLPAHVDDFSADRD